VVFVDQLGGAVNRVARDGTVFGRGAHRIACLSRAPGPRRPRPTNVRWTRDFWGAVRPCESVAAPVNLDADEQARPKAVYSGRYERLAALKKKYDPTNFFRLNQYIKPAA
jgi:hypothetical protein